LISSGLYGRTLSDRASIDKTSSGDWQGVAMATGYDIDTDRDRLDLDAIWDYLHHHAYWGRGRSRADVETQIAGAWRVVGAYAEDGAQVGFARAVSDGVAFAYLADVFVLKDHRRHGLGRRLVRTMIDDGPGAHFRWLLHTGDAAFLYASFGFRPTDRTVLERPAGGPGPIEP
jgi:GNAT superfamily N-acetyltransferase